MHQPTLSATFSPPPTHLYYPSHHTPSSRSSSMRSNTRPSLSISISPSPPHSRPLPPASESLMFDLELDDHRSSSPHYHDSDTPSSPPDDSREGDDDDEPSAWARMAAPLDEPPALGRPSSASPAFGRRLSKGVDSPSSSFLATHPTRSMRSTYPLQAEVKASSPAHIPQWTTRGRSSTVIAAPLKLRTLSSSTQKPLAASPLASTSSSSSLRSPISSRASSSATSDDPQMAAHSPIDAGQLALHSSPVSVESHMSPLSSSPFSFTVPALVPSTPSALLPSLSHSSTPVRISTPPISFHKLPRSNSLVKPLHAPLTPSSPKLDGVPTASKRGDATAFVDSDAELACGIFELEL